MKEIEELASKIVNLLKELNKTLSTAESCTGGLIASTITDIPGASKVFLGGMIVYATDMKRRLLGIPEEVFQYGVISSQMASELASKIKLITGSDYSIATTGNLGPDVMEGKPKGLIYIAVSGQKDIYVKELHLNESRILNKQKATLQALSMFLELLN